MTKEQKTIQLILFICILIIIALFIGFLVYYFVMNKSIDGFNNRNTRIKIYQSQEILDPDELPEFEDNDPDDNPMIYDPDQQPLLDDEETYQLSRRK